jgi:hypothetical protein
MARTLLTFCCGAPPFDPSEEGAALPGSTLLYGKLPSNFPCGLALKPDGAVLVSCHKMGEYAKVFAYVPGSTEGTLLLDNLPSTDPPGLAVKPDGTLLVSCRVGGESAHVFSVSVPMHA